MATFIDVKIIGCLWHKCFVHLKMSLFKLSWPGGHPCNWLRTYTWYNFAHLKYEWHYLIAISVSHEIAYYIAATYIN